MSKAELTQEEIEDQEDIDRHLAVMNDPDNDWVEWREFYAEVQSQHRKKSEKVVQEVPKAAAATA